MLVNDAIAVIIPEFCIRSIWGRSHQNQPHYRPSSAFVLAVKMMKEWVSLQDTVQAARAASVRLLGSGAALTLRALR